MRGGAASMRHKEPPRNVGGKAPRMPTAVPADANPQEWIAGETKREWKRITGLLSAQKVLTEQDLAALWVYSTAYAEYRYATAMVHTHGQIVISQSGVPIASPWIAAQTAASNRLQKMLTVFSLSPEARSKSKVDTSGDDGKEEFF